MLQYVNTMSYHLVIDAEFYLYHLVTREVSTAIFSMAGNGRKKHTKLSETHPWACVHILNIAIYIR